MLALLSLGSNIGDRVENLIAAKAALKKHVEILATAPLYETLPVGVEDQPLYLNTALKVKFEQSPQELLTMIHDIEQALGRKRDIHWGPRTIDIDIIDIEGFRSESPRLRIPHPRAKERSFVTVPCADIAPEWRVSATKLGSTGIATFNDQRWQDTL